MAGYKRDEIRYKRHHRLPQKLRYGRRVRCDITGFLTNEYRLVDDGRGNQVDPRYDALDAPDPETGFAGYNLTTFHQASPST